MTAWLSLLGMARRAGAVAVGEAPAGEAVQDHKARLVLVAADAGETTRARMERLASDKLPVKQVAASRQELGSAVGFAAAAAVAITDLGFAAAVAGKLAAEDPEWQSAADELSQRQSKALRRKADTAKHGKKSKRRKP